ncbi:hypothetical protein BGZ76_002020 [Entomortierella beljakovae]|nr:hypothetical protein BGZ76_002020 [Entomortierella beljakovae]
MKRHISSLHSITLVYWSSPFSGISMLDDPHSFNPIPVHSIRSLTLRNSVVRKNHLSSFWVIFQHLEVLKLIETKIDLVALVNLAILMNPTTSIDDVVILPNIQELVIHKLKPHDAHTQFRILISRCSLLRKLDWYFAPPYMPPMDSFIYTIFSGQLPLLEYLVINFYTPGPADRIVHQLLENSSGPLKVPDLKASSIVDRYLELCTDHFSTLQTIDLHDVMNRTFKRYNSKVPDMGTNSWTIQILTSCPVLEVLKSKVLTRDDIVSSGRWVCRRLKKLSVYINMGVTTNGNHGRFTTGELQDCQYIYQKLADLEELQELDMRGQFGAYGYVNQANKVVYRCSLVPLPLRLKAGLGYLSRLSKLESLTFWGEFHPVPKKELMWMLDHWKRLRRILGSYRIAWRTAPLVKDRYLWEGELYHWLTSKGIHVSCHREEHLPRYKWISEVKYVDRCGLSDDEEEDETKVLTSKLAILPT